MGYPEFYDPNSLAPISDCDGFFGSTRKMMNEASKMLNAMIEGVAQGRPGFKFVDVNPEFKGHQICGSGSKYIHDVKIQMIEGDLDLGEPVSAR